MKKLTVSAAFSGTRRALAVHVQHVGVNLGGDFAVFFSRQIGVGVTAQYAAATVQMTLPSGAADVKAGGVHIAEGYVCVSNRRQSSGVAIGE